MDLPRAERGNDFLLCKGEKIFCARARWIHLWIYRARARKRFSSLCRGENFLRSGAENPHLDLPRPSAETIFFSVKGRKFSALGRGESTFGSTAPERGNDFLLYIGEKIFCAWARRIHIWIYRARARKRFSSLYRGENFLRSGAENPPLDLPRPDFLRSGAENPHLDLPRPSAETIFFSIKGRKISALGRGESTFGSTAPERGNDFLLCKGEKIFCARARWIHLWIYRARARKRFSSLCRGENFLRSGAENPHLDLPRPSAETIFFSVKGRKFSALGRGESTFGSTAPERGNDFLLYIGEKIFCAWARRIHIWIYRARARKRFSSLYRGENFLRSGAENPHLDLPRPSAETIFFSVKGRKFSALGRGESTFGSTAPERGNDFLLYVGEKIFCARARRIHIWIYRARARKRFSSL